VGDSFGFDIMVNLNRAELIHTHPHQRGWVLSEAKASNMGVQRTGSKPPRNCQVKVREPVGSLTR
jgi:hypothetical protein